MLKKLLLSAALAASMMALAAPANALLTVSFTDGVTTASCSDGGSCDNQGASNQILQINQNVGTFHIFGIFAESTSGSLSASSLVITNTGAAGTLQMLFGDTSFAVPVSAINEAASLTFNNNVGAGASSLAFYAGPGNAQPTFGAPGDLLFTVNGTPTTVADAFSGNTISPFSSANPFAMAEYASLNLLSGASVTGFSQTMDVTAAVPEPSTWAMMILGFCGIIVMGAKNRRKTDGPSFRFA